MDSDWLPSLASDVLWQVLCLLGDRDLRAAGCARRQLLSPSARACLCLHLLQLDLERRSLTAVSHVKWRLCPRGRGECSSPKASKSVQQVLRRLAQLAEQGDRVALTCMLPWIERGDCSTRAAAILAAARVARRGDRSALGAVLRGLRNPGPGDGTLAAACEALGRLAVPGDRETVDKVYALLQDPAPRVRCAALRALPMVVPKGDAQAVRTLLDRSGDAGTDVREAAMLSLGQVVLDTDCATLSRMLRGLRDESVHVRRAAREALEAASGGSFSAAAARESDEAFAKGRSLCAGAGALELGEEEASYRSRACFMDAF